MAYNSDGYIMIDFTEVDFRRTNQTIEGLYKRCVDVIGTNKFILVINANGRTPLPATCSFTNNQYVIDTCIYMFAISSNDNLFIRRNDVPASDIIDDNSVSVDKTWSSNKINSELDGKADTSALANYQPLLTAVSPISIENDNISVDLSGKQDTLTAGDNITINNNVISAQTIEIKSFTYVGDGQLTKTIRFNTKPKIFCGIGITTGGIYHLLNATLYGVNNSIAFAGADNTSTNPTNRTVQITYDDNEITLYNSESAARVLNTENVTYTIYYI